MPKGVPIRLFHATTAGALPPAGSLTAGELALDALDSPPHLYTLNGGGTVIDLLSDGAPTLPLSIANGGTGATTGAGALDNLSGTSGATAGWLNRNAAGQWVMTDPAGIFAPINNPNFTGTVSVAGTALSGLFAPLTNPANGQNNYLPINIPAFTGTMTGSVSGTQFVSLNTAANQAAPWYNLLSLVLTQPNSIVGGLAGDFANMLGLTSNGNWGTIATISNSATGTHARTEFVFANDAGEYGQLRLSNTGWTSGGLQSPENNFVMLTNARNGMNFYSAEAQIKFWIADPLSPLVAINIMSLDYQASLPNLWFRDGAQILNAHAWWPDGNNGWVFEPGPGDLSWFTYGPLRWFHLRRSDGAVINWAGLLVSYGYLDLSDVRTKRAIEPGRYGLEIIRQLNPIDFERVPPQARGVPERELGFSAQEVMAVFPKAARSLGPAPEEGPEPPQERGVPQRTRQAAEPVLDDTLGVLPTALIALCVNAIKELDEKVIALENK